MGSICPYVSKSIIDEDFTNKMQEAIGESIVSIPIAYKVSSASFINPWKSTGKIVFNKKNPCFFN